MTTPQGGVNLGSAYGSITINDNIDAAIGKATQSFDNALSAIGGRMEQLGKRMSSIGSQLTVVTAPLTAFGVAGIRTAATYEDALKEIQVRAGLTADELATVVDKTKQIGLESQYGPAQAADAFLQLLTSGSSVAEAMEQIDAVIAGAAASGSDLGFTADALTDIMAAMGLEASQSADVMQTLINATGASSATFRDLVAGFQNVGPAARNMGLSVEDTAAALAVFSENGIKGSEAGTQLRSMLNNMLRDTDDVKGMWNQLGVSLFDAQGNMRDLDSIIDDLNRAMDGMNDEQRNNVITTLAGTYGQLGLSALLAEGGIDQMTESMRRQTAIEAIAASRLDTFNGQIQFLRGSVELLMIDALMPLMNDALRPMIEWTAALVGRMREWIVANPELTNRIVQILAVVAVLGPALVILGQVIGFVGSVLGVLGSILGFVLSPIGLLIIGIGALVYIFRDQLAPVIDTVKSAIIDFIETVKGLWAAFEEGGVSGAATFLYDNVFVPIRDSVQNINWSEVGTKIMDALGAALSLAVNFATWVYDNILMPIWNNVSTAVASVDWGAVGSNIMSALGTAFTTLIAWGTWVFDNILTPMVTFAGEAIANIDWYGVGAGIVNAIGTALKTVFDFVAWIIDSIFNPTVDNAEDAAGQIDWISVGVAIFNGIASALTAAFNFVMWLYDNILSPLVQGAADAIAQTDWSGVGGGIMNAIRNALPNIWQWVQDNIITPVRNALSAFNPMDVISGVGDIVSDIGNSAGQWVSNTFGGSRDSGGRGQAGMPYLIGAGAQPELFIPDSAGTFYPNADEMFSGGANFAGAIFNIHANSEAEGREGARGFHAELMELMRST